MSNQKQLTVQELIEKGETELLKTLGNATSTSHNVYKTITNQLVQFSELSNTLTIEVKRLQELLRKNNIQFTLPVEPVKLPENIAVVLEPELVTPETINL